MGRPAASSDAIRQQLTRVLGSTTFQGVGRSRALLQFLVEETLNGRSDRLKEYTLGAEALGKGESFDPRTDPIVRAEASRLRSRLERYYAMEGRADPIAIELPKGGYVLQFRVRDAHAPSPLPPVNVGRLMANPLWFAVAVIMLVVIAAVLWAETRVTRRTDVAVARFDVALLPDNVLGSEVGTDVIISPDGTRVVFVAQASTGESRLHTRRLDQPDALELTGTEGARAPFFSPDGQWVAFWAAGKLKKTPVAGGSPQILCDAPDLLGGSWGDDGSIVAALARGQLSRIPSSGGSPSVLLDLSAESLAPLWPQVLPGAASVLFTAIGAPGPNAGTIQLLSLSDGHRRVLVRNATFGRYLANGYLAYVNQGTMFAVPFAPAHPDVHDAAASILDDVAYSSTFGFAQMDVSRTGTLVYRRSVAGGRFIVDAIDAAGAIAPLLRRPGHYLWPRLSPDGQRVALTATESGTDNLSIYDPRTDETTRIDGLTGQSSAPLWTHDGRLLVIGRADGLSVIEPRADAKAARLLQSDRIQVPWSFSPDGRRLAYYEMTASRGFDLWTVPVAETADGLVAGHPEPFLQTPAFEVYPSFSPDGRWLAYSSNESGAWEVYVRAFPDNETKIRVSTDGGRIPLWSPSSQELLYETDRQTVMAVRYTVRNGAFAVSTPREWLRGRVADTGVLANFDVSADGRVVALMPADRSDEGERGHDATFVLNFFELVRQRLAPSPN